MENIERPERYNNFNIIRFFAAGLVIYGHMYPLLGLPHLSIFNQAISTIAVKIFFVLSGYLVAQSYMNDSNILRYSIRRFFRIIPGLAFLVLITVFIVGPLTTTLSMNDYFTHKFTLGYFENIFLYINYSLPGVFANNFYPNAVNGSLWTLPVEVFAYILLVPIVILCRKLKKHEFFGLAVMAAISIAIGMYMRIKGLRIVLYASSVGDAFSLIPYFFLGSLFTHPKLRKLLNVQVGIAMLAVAAVLNISEIKMEFLFFIVLPYSTLSFALAEKPVFAKAFAKNDYSYGLYLYGFLAQQILVNFLKGFQISYNYYAVMSFVLAMIFAFVSWHLVEKPAQNLGKKLIAILRKKEAMKIKA